jgi:hypothetical protein
MLATRMTVINVHHEACRLTLRSCCAVLCCALQVTPHVGDPKTWASRILVLGYAFLVLIMVHLFTGRFPQGLASALCLKCVRQGANGLR